MLFRCHGSYFHGMQVQIPQARVALPNLPAILEPLKLKGFKVPKNTEAVVTGKLGDRVAGRIPKNCVRNAYALKSSSHPSR